MWRRLTSSRMDLLIIVPDPLLLHTTRLQYLNSHILLRNRCPLHQQHVDCIVSRYETCHKHFSTMKNVLVPTYQSRCQETTSIWHFVDPCTFGVWCKTSMLTTNPFSMPSTQLSDSYLKAKVSQRSKPCVLTSRWWPYLLQSPIPLTNLCSSPLPSPYWLI